MRVVWFACSARLLAVEAGLPERGGLNEVAACRFKS
jgi:hypothetical protein